MNVMNRLLITCALCFLLFHFPYAAEWQWSVEVKSAQPVEQSFYIKK